LDLVLVVLAGCVLVGLSWLAWRSRKEKPHLFVGWFWFVGTLVPVIGLVQVGGQAMADRYTYIPSIGLFLALVFEGRYWVQRWRVPSAVTASIAGLLLTSCLAGTGFQLRYWKDSGTLFAHAVTVTGENAIARINLGVALEKQGKLSEALAEYKEAVRINPDLAQGHNNLANLLDATGKPEEALSHYREAVRLKPRAELPHLNLAAQLLELGKFDEAMSEYKIAGTLKPDDSRPHYRMGKALLRHGRSAEATAQFRQALSLDPVNPQVLVYLARVLAADQNSLNRNGNEAVGLAEKANELTRSQDSFVLDTLGIACAEAGRFKEAQQAARIALDLAGKDDDKKTVSAIEARLQLYEAGQPYHEDFSKSQP
jgi:Flp pilus assembly protein TadD